MPRVRVPAALARVAAVLAAPSLCIYLVHWEVWPIFEGGYGLHSLAASLAAGIGLWLVASQLPSLAGRAGSPGRAAMTDAGSPGAAPPRP